MKVFASIVLLLFAGVQAANLVSAQVRTEIEKKQDSEKKPDSSSANQAAVNSAPEKKPEMISIQLVGGGRLEVEELRETSEGFWYKRGGVTTLLDPKRVAHVERPSANHTKATIAPVQDSLRWSLADSKKVETFFFNRFGRPLPTSAFGQSDIHDRWGLDHRQGMDVGLHPDSPEGIALVDFLKTEKIPFLVFRHAIPGVATGPHIHIGFPSHRYLPR
ncbi:MAG TPA: hypothetical protein VIX17_09570 [Pyrinomonadaceae bacterium]